MAKKRRKEKTGRKDTKRLLGTFSLFDDKTAVGALHLAGSKTNLRLHSDEALPRIDYGSCIRGHTYDGTCVTLVDCTSPGWGNTYRKDKPARYHADVFPHYVVTGEQHLDPTEACITGIHFSTTDLASLFYDFDAFGNVIGARSIIDVVLEEPRRRRPIEAGEWPDVYYYTGKDRIVEVDTVLGKISVNHRPTQSMGGPTGFFMKNRIVVSIEPPAPITFKTAIERMHEVCVFLSVAAGRAQGIDQIDIGTTGATDEIPQFLRVRESYRWKARDDEHRKPHPGDVPLNPIDRRDEFDAVLADWLARQASWRVARGRYLECMRKSYKYSSERLVAAANMFDILPQSAFPTPSPLGLR